MNSTLPTTVPTPLLEPRHPRILCSTKSSMKSHRKKQVPSTSNISPLPTKCHYTMQNYICTHKTWLKSPRITHLAPCPLSVATPSRSRARFLNMAPSPHSTDVPELCPKCRPYTLGADGKKLRDFEQELRQGDMYLGAELEELERGLRGITLQDRQEDGADNAECLSSNTKPLNEVRAVAKLAEQNEDEEAIKDDQEQPNVDEVNQKKENLVIDQFSSLPPAATGSAESSQQLIFKRAMGAAMLTSNAATASNTSEMENDRPDEAKEGEEWVQVEHDPDWAILID